MQTFVDQPGVPLISVSSTCQAGHGTVTLAQSRYSMNGPAAADAPIGRFRCASKRADPRRPAHCSTPRAGGRARTPARRGRWATPNGKGYYRTALDEAALKAAAANVSKMSAPERLTLLVGRVGAGPRRHPRRRQLSGPRVRLRIGDAATPCWPASSRSLRSIDQHMTTPETRRPSGRGSSRLLGPNAAEATVAAARQHRATTSASTRRAVLLGQLGAVGDPSAHQGGAAAGRPGAGERRNRRTRPSSTRR